MRRERCCSGARMYALPWKHHQCERSHCLAERRATPPLGMPIDSPHGSCIRRKRQLLGGFAAPRLDWPGPWVSPPQSAPTPPQQNVARACLFASPVPFRFDPPFGDSPPGATHHLSGKDARHCVRLTAHHRCPCGNPWVSPSKVADVPRAACHWGLGTVMSSLSSAYLPQGRARPSWVRPFGG